MSINIASFNQPTTFKGLSFILKYFLGMSLLCLIFTFFNSA
ncbi:SCPU domain-containing protein, partial [Acinetobacter baumannii]